MSNRIAPLMTKARYDIRQRVQDVQVIIQLSFDFIMVSGTLYLLLDSIAEVGNVQVAVGNP